MSPTWVVLILLIVSMGMWGWLLGRTVLIASRTVVVRPLPTKRTSARPYLSVLLPVRNEAERVLPQCLRSLLMQDYDQYEVVAVDDCSEDESLKILRQFGKENSRLHVIEGIEPRDGWIGKTWALEQAKHAARGDWLLAVDADVIYSPCAFSAAMDMALKFHYDAITLLPLVDLLGKWERILFPSFAWLSIMRMPPTVASDPRSRHCFGMGQFILMRRSAHDSIGGYSRYSGHVLDDCWTMQLLKDAGYKVLAGDGTHLFRTRMYRSFKEIVDGFSKNAFAAMNYHIPRTLGVIGLTTALLSIPIAGVALYLAKPEMGSSVSIAVIFLSCTSLALMLGTSLVILKRCRWPLRYAGLFWLGLITSAVVLARSMLQLKGGNARWKGRPVRIPTK